VQASDIIPAWDYSIINGIVGLQTTFEQASAIPELESLIAQVSCIMMRIIALN
jgi:hypothetical protein